MRKEIPLTQGQIVIVDECDYAQQSQFKWYAQWSERSKTYYAARRVRVGDKRHVIYMHREIMQTSKGLDTDHIDKNGLHNWRDNLRIATRAQNTQSARGPKNKTGFRGVRRTNDPRYKLKVFIAKIVFHGKTIFLGNFKTAEEASAVYEAKAKELFGDFYLPPNQRGQSQSRGGRHGNNGISIGSNSSANYPQPNGSG